MNVAAPVVEVAEGPMRTARLLVVEDERIVARSLRKQLTRLGYEIVGTVASGTEAFQRSEELHPDLVLMDIQLEGPIDGVEAAEKIRAELQLPVVYLTAYSDKETLERAKFTQPYGYIIKPYEDRDLHVVIETALYKSQREREVIQSKNLEIERAIRVRDHFLESLSHELRTPLNVIIGFTGTLLMELPGPLTPMQNEQLRIVENSANQLLSLLANLLDLAKIQSGNVELKLEAVVLKSVLAEVVETLRSLSEARDVQLDVDIRTPEAVVQADPRVVTRILLHLASNAVECTGKGTVRLEMDQCQDEGRLLTEIRVVDTATDIHPDELAEAFDSFSKAETSGQYRQGSTVLDLYLMRKLAQLAGAEVMIQSELGKSHIFTLVWSDELEPNSGTL